MALQFQGYGDPFARQKMEQQRRQQQFDNMNQVIGSIGQGVNNYQQNQRQQKMDDGTPEALAKARFHKSGSMLHPGEYEKQLGRIMAEFDSPDIIQSQVLWKPEGGRAGGWGFPSKSNPLPW